MANGYTGKLLFVDLTSGTITEETRDEAFYRKWIGGTGLAAAIIAEKTAPGIDPLGPDNMLAFATGPLTGTGVYGGGRYTVACKSPLTGGWADSNSGGTWGPELKFAGYDGLFVTGAAASPVCIVIDKGETTIVPAADLWGKDTYETEDAVQERLGDPGTWVVTCIGPAGERLSLLAGIVNEKGRIAARSGVGAAMGSKKLKAIAVRGTKGARVGVANKEGLKAIQKRYGQELKDSPFHQGLTAAGTGGGTSFLLSIGDCPADNWNTSGTDALPNCSNLDAAKMDIYKLKSYGCHTCPVRCGALIQVDEGPYATDGECHRPEYETLAALGPMCHNDQVLPLIKANEICNRYGADTIGVGATVAFAMECFENGLIDKSDTGGLELTWGNPEALVTLTRQICAREGFGDVLADGSKYAAERIGKGSDQYAIHVAGRPMPYHDPRMSPGHATMYISDAQPANHCGPNGMTALEGGGALGADPLLQPEDSAGLFVDYEKRGDTYARGSAWYELLSSAGLCALYATFYAPPTVELLQPVTGWDIDWSEGLEAGRRILTMRQMFNMREKVDTQSFRFPKRFETPLNVGPGAGVQIPFEQLREVYFAGLGWDAKTGAPRKETLAALGIN